MDGCRFEEVHVDLVEVCYGADNVAGDVAFAVKFFEAAPDVNVLTFGGKGLRSLRVGIAVNPLLYVYKAGAVVDFEGCVRGLGGDVVNLANEGELWIRQIGAGNEAHEGSHTWVTSLPSILKSASGWGRELSQLLAGF